MKKLLITLTAVLILLNMMASPAFAAGNKYYMIEGRIDEFGGEITRVGTVEMNSTIKKSTNQEYAIAAVDRDGSECYTVGLDVSFKSSSDAGVPLSEYAEFIAMIPYDSNIEEFYLYDANYEYLDSLWLEGYIQTEISYFNVSETDTGFYMEWDVSLEDDSYADWLSFDIIAVSKNTGEKNILAYRISDRFLDIPHDWLDPNDEIVFVLESNDKVSTLSAESDTFHTLDGESKTISEDWSDNEDNGGDSGFLLPVIIGGVAAAGAGTVIFVNARKKNKFKKKI